jgi:hypothetical protein
MTVLHRFAAPLGAIACLVATGAIAAPDCSAAPAMTPLQQRVAARAAEGVDAMRRFVTVRQAIYQLDVYATMDQGTAHHEWLSQCGRAQAHGASIVAERKSP